VSTLNKQIKQWLTYHRDPLIQAILITLNNHFRTKHII